MKLKKKKNQSMLKTYHISIEGKGLSIRNYHSLQASSVPQLHADYSGNSHHRPVANLEKVGNGFMHTKVLGQFKQ
jgi:hypothetical protein